MPVHLIGYIKKTGYAIFSVKDDSYSYRGIEGPDIDRIAALQLESSGKAISIAKKGAKEVKKNDGEWEPNPYYIPKFI